LGNHEAQLSDYDWLQYSVRAGVRALCVNPGKTIFQRLIAENCPIITTVITDEEQMRGWLDLVARSTKLEAQARACQMLHQHTLILSKN
jgi:hypothetical protein